MSDLISQKEKLEVILGSLRKHVEPGFGRGFVEMKLQLWIDDLRRQIETETEELEEDEQLAETLEGKGLHGIALYAQEEAKHGRE